MASEKRLIDANAVMHKINAFAASVVYRGSDLMFTGKDTCNPHEYTRGYERGILDAQKLLGGQPTVDAVEVVHGRWENITGGMVTLGDCSECKVRQPVIGTNYCKNCGAKMDGERKDNG